MFTCRQTQGCDLPFKLTQAVHNTPRRTPSKQCYVNSGAHVFDITRVRLPGNSTRAWWCEWRTLSVDDVVERTGLKIGRLCTKTR